MVTRWFSNQPKRDRLSWASILVVMALGLQSMPEGSQNIHETATGETWMSYCMRNAQSTLPELMARDEDLVGLQVMVSLALLFQGSVDLRPSSVLLGMAIRLTHRMQLHQKDPGRHFSDGEAQQRSNVFWITYLLDKDISLRMKTPSLLSDDDINLPLPDHESSTNGGFIHSLHGDVSLNMLYQRARLAQIESKINALICSNHYLEYETSTRRDRVASLGAMLEQWYSEIPAAFKPANAPSSLKPVDLAQVMYLHHVYLFCLICIHGIWSAKSEWMCKIGSFSKAAIEDIMVTIQGPRVTTCLQLQEPPSIAGWNHCVSATREAIQLFLQAPLASSSAWLCTCAQFSGMIILLADIIIHPSATTKSQDLRLVKASKQKYDQFLGGAPSHLHESLNLIIDDLLQRAGSCCDDDNIEHSSGRDSANAFSLGMESSETLLSNGLPEFGYEDIQAMNFGFPDFMSSRINEENMFLGLDG
ncbi:unnamed protein product [Clonostachys solani]|uniref:Xylanolytic transcriptional activator regulatory domain-containing protein n=1 Tax=Clonostachys solani TaxID=160281 RepID=A0A9P0ENR5_9HYPO|nr:unnamed protein product [Clonostachys solani]